MKMQTSFAMIISLVIFNFSEIQATMKTRAGIIDDGDTHEYLSQNAHDIADIGIVPDLRTDRQSSHYSNNSRNVLEYNATQIPGTYLGKRLGNHHPMSLGMNSILEITEFGDGFQLLEKEDEESLELLLTTLILRDFERCDLVILIDGSFQFSRIPEALVRLPNFKQVVWLDDWQHPEEEVEWRSSRCQGVFFLITDPEPMIHMGNHNLFDWDYKARVVIVGLPIDLAVKFTQTNKGKKTEHILGLIKTEKEGGFDIFMNELYWGDRGMIRITKWIGWTFTKKINLFPDKISNLRQSVINVAIFEWQPAIFYRRDKDGNILLRYGRDVDVVLALTEAFNFSFIYKETHHEELFGHRLDNGSFNGQVGQMYNGEGDIGIANIWLSSLAGRNEFQAYSAPFEVDTSCCMARVEPPLPLWQSPGLPFQVVTWLAVFVGLLLAGPLLFLLATISGKNEPEESNLLSLITSSLYAYGVHFSQPLQTLPYNSSTQIFVAFLWIYSMMLTTGYRSNLTAFLTITKQPKSIETFKGLYENKMEFVGIPYHRDAIKFSKNPYLSALVHTYKVKMRFEDITADILSGRAVTLNSKSYLELVGGIVTATTNKPKFRIMKECFAFYAVGIVYQKHSPLKPKMDLMITRMFESGMVRRWFLDSLKLYHKFEKQDEEEQRALEGAKGENEASEGVIPLTTEHVQGIFILLLCGCFLSVVLFTVESLVAKPPRY